MRPQSRLLQRKNLRIYPHLRSIPYKRCMMACRLRRRARRSPNCCAAKTLSVQQRLPREKQEHHQEAESGVLEDQPGEPQPLAFSGQQPRKHRGAEREGDGKAKDPEDGDQLAELGRKAGDTSRRLFGPLEAHRFECVGGERGAQQLVVDRVAGLVCAERAKQRPS
jgi:hypothetical protein